MGKISFCINVLGGPGSINKYISVWKPLVHSKIPFKMASVKYEMVENL